MKTKKKTQASKSRSFRPLLKEIVRFLNVKDVAAAELWWILTALRGPDNSACTAKPATTAVIRYACGLAQGVGNYATITKDSGPSVDIRCALDPYSDHFALHASEAFRVLGLKWTEVNKR